MYITLTVNIDNAAFQEDLSGELRSVFDRMLRKVESLYLVGGSLIDSNGNTVGRWEVHD